MTVYDIPNITVEAIGNPAFLYRINAVEGYVIRLPDFPENVYKTATVVYPTTDFNAVQVIPRTELPEGAEIYGVGDNNDHEIM